MSTDWIEEATAHHELGGILLLAFDSPQRYELNVRALPMDVLFSTRTRCVATQNPFNLEQDAGELPAGAGILVVAIGVFDLGMLEALCDVGSRPGCRMLRVRPTTATFQMALSDVGRMLGFPSGVLVKTLSQLGATDVEVEFSGLPVSGPVKVTVDGAGVATVEEVDRDGRPGRKWKREEPKPAEPAQPAPAPPTPGPPEKQPKAK